ncbi:NAD-dependent protein deacylase-like [Anthonomus grandis grandis]|uniref:NAD-dependent protein deacylase-like n=1 Tax=Anthonomus grandis grandis TaxID=2921223 RepID=UPI002166BBAE|nr:NAD-dependent protein deacylase-like [Anthonomus grandis grandis]
MASSSKGLNNFQGFKKVLDQAKNIIVLSGAGISAESGIPVFRGLTGIWRNHKPTSLATPEAFTANPALVWEFYHYRRCVAFNAPPNNAHLALAKFEQDCKTQNKNFHIITQNVDGLHHRAGSKNVLELHGALSKIRCTHCEQVEENWENPICEALKDRGDPNVTEKSLPPIDIAELPKCKTCGKLARPHIVWFGENLDLNLFEQARNLVEACDLCLLVGTSSVVMPAAMFAPLVAERGYPVAEFNLNDASGQENFQFHFPGPCGTCLPKALGYED